MINYREILRLKKLWLNNSRIAQSLGCSRTTVIQVLNATIEKGIGYPLPEELSDRKLSGLLFPSDRFKAGIQNVGLRVRSSGVAEERSHIESLVARVLREVP